MICTFLGSFRSRVKHLNVQIYFVSIDWTNILESASCIIKLCSAQQYFRYVLCSCLLMQKEISTRFLNPKNTLAHGKLVNKGKLRRKWESPLCRLNWLSVPSVLHVAIGKSNKYGRYADQNIVILTKHVRVPESL